MDKSTTLELLDFILASISIVNRRFNGINKSDDFIFSDEGLDKLGPFKNLCQSGKITNTQGNTDEYRNRCRPICS